MLWDQSLAIPRIPMLLSFDASITLTVYIKYTSGNLSWLVDDCWLYLMNPGCIYREENCEVNLKLLLFGGFLDVKGNVDCIEHCFTVQAHSLRLHTWSGMYPLLQEIPKKGRIIWNKVYTGADCVCQKLLIVEAVAALAASKQPLQSRKGLW